MRISPDFVTVVLPPRGPSVGMSRAQLWLWFIGMLVLTLPWHLIGVQGQPRRVSSTPYDTELVAVWGPSEAIMIVGGVILLISALLLVLTLARRGGTVAQPEVEYAEPIHPVMKIPNLLNSFAFWNVVILIYIVASYGYPIAQFFIMVTYGTIPWGI